MVHKIIFCVMGNGYSYKLFPVINILIEGFYAIQEYERKRDVKRRERQLYHLRHTRDYEALEVPLGASKAEVKKAYKKLAMKWHPDKHKDNEEEAKARFQEIQRAYQSLMSTDEDQRVEQIGT